MEIVQTGTSTWPWCMSMFGARFAVFVRRARMLPGPCPATRNLRSVGVHRRRTLFQYNTLFTFLRYTTVVLVVCDAIYFLSFQYYIEHTSCSTHHKHQKTMYVYILKHTLGLGKWKESENSVVDNQSTALTNYVLLPGVAV